MEAALLQALGTLGVGGVIAWIVIRWKQADDIERRKDMREMAERHEEEMEAWAERFEKVSVATATAIDKMADAVLRVNANVEKQSQWEQIRAELRELRGVVHGQERQ